jgi:tetratricopeptide (TPR) repeat protein
VPTGDTLLLVRHAVLLLLAGCAHSAVRPDVHQRGWLEVETPHISLRTDLERDDAIWRARQLEQFWAALAHLYDLVAPGAPPPAGRFSVILLASCADFQHIAWQDVSGFAAPMDGQLVAVTCEANQGDTVIHELAHLFNHHHFPRLPRWVDEGLATYYSTLQVRDGRAVLGNFPSQLSPYWNRPGWLPSLSALRHLSSDEFYRDRAGANYFCAWKLVHVLNNTDRARQAGFRAYLQALRAGVPDDTAWQEAFRDVPAGPLADDYATYQRRDRVNRLVTSYDWSEPSPPRVRALRPGEAHFLWARLLAVAHAGEVAEQLERAAAADPDWPGLLYARAVLLRPRDAVELLRRYVARVPDDPRGWQALVSARMNRAVPAGYSPLDRPPPPALRGMQDDVRKLIEHSDTPDALNQIGWYFALARNPNAGLNFALRAVQAEPSCAECWDTVGLLYFEAGKLALAIAAQERAVGIYAERAPDEVVVRLRRFRAALRRPPPAGSAR